ncbi:hypothetical protein ACODUM_02500 [Stenotrophomonas maltophilia]
MFDGYMSFSDFVNIAMLATALTFAFYFTSLYFRRQDRIRQEERRERAKEREIDAQQRHDQQQFAEEQAQRRFDEENRRAQNQQSTNSGGYIVIDMPEEQKSMFFDVLKGFEEFSKLKGYSVSFSLDNSVADKVSFKFTILDQGITVSTKKVQADLREYIQRVQEGGSLDDLPVVIPDAEHAALILAMKNRINYLQHTYTAQKNVVEFYHRFLKDHAAGMLNIQPAHNFYLQAGGNMTPSNYSAIGSNNVAQGKHIEASHNVVDQSVHIAGSFNEKKQQLDNLDALIAGLQAAHLTPTEDSRKAIVNLEKVKDELTTEEKPDGDRIAKWLDVAKNSMKALSLGKDLLDLATKAYGAFQLSI